LEAVEEGIDLTSTLMEEMGSQPDDVLRMAMLEKTAGQLHAALEQHELAEQYFTRSIASLSEFDEHDAQPSIDLLYVKGEALYAVAEAYTASHQTKKALTLLSEAQNAFEELLARAPGLGNAYHKLGQIHIQRAQCYLDQIHYADAIEEYDKMAAHAVEISKIPDSKEMSAGYQILANTAKAARLVATHALWKSLDNLLKQGRYEEILEQATKYASYDQRETNKFRLAIVLANSVTSIQGDEKLAPDKQAKLAEQLAQQAITWLSELWEQGYIKQKKSRLAGLISSQPSLADLQEQEEFKAFKDREDFQRLLKRIEAGR